MTNSFPKKTSAIILQLLADETFPLGRSASQTAFFLCDRALPTAKPTPVPIGSHAPIWPVAAPSAAPTPAPSANPRPIHINLLSIAFLHFLLTAGRYEPEKQGIPHSFALFANEWDFIRRL
jgi:hypothetical protein